MVRLLIVLAAGVGMACVSVAFGFLYKDYSHRESAWNLLRYAGGLSDAERQALVVQSNEMPYLNEALVSGTLGVVIIAIGVAGAVLESRFVGRREEITF